MTSAQTSWSPRRRCLPPPPRFRTSAANRVFYNIVLLYFYHAILARRLRLVSSDEFQIYGGGGGVPNVYMGKYAAAGGRSIVYLCDTFVRRLNWYYYNVISGRRVPPGRCRIFLHNSAAFHTCTAPNMGGACFNAISDFPGPYLLFSNTK